MTSDEERMLNECLAAEHGLTGWEIDFIDDLDQHREATDGFELSPKQHDKLKQIVEKVA